MRWVAAAIVGLCVASAALAQETPAFAPRFEARPGGRDFANNYPRPALRNGIQGIVVLCCTVSADRRYNCEAAFEAPQGQGFGDASVVIGREFILTPESYAEYQARPHRIRQALRWTFQQEQSEAFNAASRQIAEQTANICAPSAETVPLS